MVGGANLGFNRLLKGPLIIIFISKVEMALAIEHA